MRINKNSKKKIYVHSTGVEGEAAYIFTHARHKKHARTHAQTCKRTHAHKHAHIRTHTHNACTHTHMHAHTRAETGGDRQR